MKTFKDKAYLPQVDKIRKDLGKFHEKSDRKAVINSVKSNNSANQSNYSLPSYDRKKSNFGAYFILVVLILLIILFIFMLFSIVFINTKNSKLEI